jgi:hypothetical protein
MAASSYACIRGANDRISIGIIGCGDRGTEAHMPDVNRYAREKNIDWLQCLRSRKTPNASIDAGHQHAVACLTAVRAFDTGRRQVYDPRKREIRNG